LEKKQQTITFLDPRKDRAGELLTRSLSRETKPLVEVLVRFVVPTQRQKMAVVKKHQRVKAGKAREECRRRLNRGTDGVASP
jgi:hypothetical protein